MPSPEAETNSVADLPITALLNELLEPSPQELVDLGSGDLHAVAADLDSRRLIFVCFDYGKNRGSIGTLEADQLVTAIRVARERQWGFVLLMNTSGIRVTDSTAGIASLRRVLREATDARLQGVRMLAMILKNAYGGASMLAAVCEQRIIHAGCSYAMSGPKLIEQVVGTDKFNADDKQGVRALIGGEARASVSKGFVLVEPSVNAYRQALLKWLAQRKPSALTPGRLSVIGESLAARLTYPLAEAAIVSADDPALSRDARDVLRSVQAEACDLWRAENVFIARGHAPSDTRVLALMSPEGSGVRDALALARELIGSVLRREGQRQCVLILDSESHAATPDDERAVLSEVLAHLALVIRAVHRHGQDVDVVVTGNGGGGIQAAIGGGATTVSMARNARLLVLPKAAMKALNKAEDSESGSIAMAIRVGAVDHSFNVERLALRGDINAS